MEEEYNNEPVKRFRDILSGDEEDVVQRPSPKSKPQIQSIPTPQSQPDSLLEKLPRNKPSDQSAMSEKKKVQKPDQQGQVQQSVQKPVRNSADLIQANELKTLPSMPRREKFLRALWTWTSVISIAFNVVILIVVFLALSLIRNFKIPENIDIMVLNHLLSGLYSNFELMDAAKISATIPVQDQIPVQFDLEINQATTVTLSEDVTIRGAYVVINTPVIDINAPAVVTLPAGTNLPIILNLVVPVDKQVPVNLNVGVDIPLSQTELHTPFVGLQEVVKPLYCLVEPAASSSLTGAPLCE